VLHDLATVVGCLVVGQALAHLVCQDRFNKG